MTHHSNNMVNATDWTGLPDVMGSLRLTERLAYVSFA